MVLGAHGAQNSVPVATVRVGYTSMVVVMVGVVVVVVFVVDGRREKLRKACTGRGHRQGGRQGGRQAGRQAGRHTRAITHAGTNDRAGEHIYTDACTHAAS